MSYYVIPRAPIGPRELEVGTLSIRYIVRSYCYVVPVALLNKELRRQYCDNDNHSFIMKELENKCNISSGYLSILRKFRAFGGHQRLIKICNKTLRITTCASASPSISIILLYYFLYSVTVYPPTINSRREVRFY